ncbi:MULTISPECIES: hypothetical protein [Ruegeria]|uniref:hypothetical protein n=1 Tax=Ruegeria TaxID=97050 RepID=UPI00163DA235|nr:MULTISPECIES: hypothetical protein [Ruegeria]
MPKSRLTNKKEAKGSLILRERKRDRHPNGQITTAWTDHDPKPLPGSQETVQGLLGQGDHSGVFWVEAGMPTET